MWVCDNDNFWIIHSKPVSRWTNFWRIDVLHKNANFLDELRQIMVLYTYTHLYMDLCTWGGGWLARPSDMAHIVVIWQNHELKTRLRPLNYGAPWCGHLQLYSSIWTHYVLFSFLQWLHQCYLRRSEHACWRLRRRLTTPTPWPTIFPPHPGFQHVLFCFRFRV